MSYLERTFDEEGRAKVSHLREMLKEALPAPVARMGAPALAGMGLGAAHQFFNKTLDARDQGQTWGDSLASGVRAIPKGALVGGAAGGLAGAVSPALGERTVNFGKGVLHTVTGWKPKGGLAELGTGSSLVGKQIQDAVRAGHDPATILRLKEQKKALQAVEEKNLTNLPGLAKGLLDPRRTLDTLGAGKDMVVKGLDGWGKAMLGLGAVGSTLPALMAEDATPGERAGMVARNLGGMLLTAPLQAATMQAGSNPGMSSLLEGMAHNDISGFTGRMADLPAAEAVRAVDRRRRMGSGPRPLPYGLLHPPPSLPQDTYLPEKVSHEVVKATERLAKSLGKVRL